jgi:hypothetical protein
LTLNVLLFSAFSPFGISMVFVIMDLKKSDLHRIQKSARAKIRLGGGSRATHGRYRDPHPVWLS